MAQSTKTQPMQQTQQNDGSDADPEDPDSNFFINYLNKSDYYTENNFNNILHSVNTLSILHLNARSLLHKIANLEILIKNLNVSFTFIIVTETWLDEISSKLVYLNN